MRSVDAAALGAMQSDNKDESFELALQPVLAAWGVRPEGNDLRGLLYEHETSSVYRNLVRARSNAQQVGPLELMNAINLLVTEMERNEGSVNTPEQVHELATVIVKLLANAYNVIETHWFRREPLSEDVMYRLFAQQQQQQDPQGLARGAYFLRRFLARFRSAARTTRSGCANDSTSENATSLPKSSAAAS